MEEVYRDLWICMTCGEAYKRNFEGKLAPAGALKEKLLCERLPIIK